MTRHRPLELAEKRERKREEELLKYEEYMRRLSKEYPEIKKVKVVKPHRKLQRNRTKNAEGEDQGEEPRNICDGRKRKKILGVF